MDNKENSKETLKQVKEKVKIIQDETPQRIDLTLKTPKKKKVIKDIIDDSKFLQLLEQQRQNFSPSLDQIDIATPTIRTTDLEQQVGFSEQPQNSLDNNGNKDNQFKYIAGPSDSNTPKYISSREDAERIIQTQRVNPLEFRKDVPFETNVREADRSSFFEQRSNSRSIETYVPIKNFDKEKVGKADPFKKQEVLYSPSDY